ncbi:MAG: hydrogenobyrinic acid a,c-diamide synthase (glutamine-hydrolyzing) [Chloroflexi bacterium]|nr:hydrogenobyrinic acid a,c-diamide synthase (glutamine-hydrolyzing) [Chloroflexota bacterium]
MEGSENARPGVVISAPQGRSGKTVASIALCSILAKRGCSVQPFKKGPDYIDPSWLAAAAGRSCRNLDPFLMSEGIVLASFERACSGADVAIVEGAMGLYDCPDADGYGSTAHLARLLKLPVVLVVNTTRMTGSIAAMVSGYQHFEPDVNIAGVILNNIAGSRHEQKLVAAVEGRCGIPVVGKIGRHSDLDMAQRHLGHVPFPENDGSASIIERIGRRLEASLDIEAILKIAGGARSARNVRAEVLAVPPCKVTIGVMRDRVFSFYYPENLEALREAGAELVFIDSLRDRLPEVDGLYIGGGFPEFFLKELEANRGLREDTAAAIEAGLPVYAECAGLMYLCRAISWQGQRHEMVGVIPAEVELTKRPQGHGYVEADVTGNNSLFPKGLGIKGHEFHHSRLVKSEGLEFAYRLRRGHGVLEGRDGIVYRNVLAAYTHLHALGTPEWGRSFVSLAQRERKHRPVRAAS